MIKELQTAGMLWPLITLIAFFIALGIGFVLGIKKQYEIQKRSQKTQRAVLGGLFSEQIAPFLPGFPEDLKPSEARFIGKPIDFIIFKGMDEKTIEEVVFVEVKSGRSQLSSQEKALRDVIQTKKVRWCEYRVDEEVTTMRSPR